ncbi:MAG: sugar-binding protein [Candidatus Poribacteria bacterium]
MVSPIIPSTYFFDFTFHCPKAKSHIKIDGDLSDWDQSYLVPDLMHLINKTPFAEVYLTWDYDNIYIGYEVSNKINPVDVDPIRFWIKDCMEVWFDLRNEKPVRAYNEHCHHFFLLPKGHKKDNQLATAGEWKEPGSSIQETIYDYEGIEIVSKITPKGYIVEARFSRSVIPTFDPVEYPIIGFNYHINNTDGKSQWWSCGPDFARHVDPSTWGSIKLID